MPRRSPAERLLAHVERRGACRVWTGKTDRDGYGIISIDYKKVRVHRLAWTLAYGPILGGLHVLHHCDNPPCIDIEHLFLGTVADNNADKMQKGRGRYVLPPVRRGESHPNAKLTDAQVAEIRRRSTGARGEQTAMAKEYGVSQVRISQLLRGF